MSCRFVLPFSGSGGPDGAKPASDGIGRQTGKLPADWARPSRPTAKCRLKPTAEKPPIPARLILNLCVPCCGQVA